MMPQLISSVKSAMAKKGKKRGRGKYIKLNNLEDKKSLFGTIKSIFDIFKSFILMAKIEIVDTSFNCHNKIFFIHQKFDAYTNILYQNLSD